MIKNPYFLYGVLYLMFKNDYFLYGFLDLEEARSGWNQMDVGFSRNLQRPNSGFAEHSSRLGHMCSHIKAVRVPQEIRGCMEIRNSLKNQIKNKDF